MSTAPDRPAVSMKTLRFSRIVKRELGGQGMTISLMLEARVPTTYPAQSAVLDLVETDGRLKMTLHPEPEPIMILDSASEVIEFSFSATETEVHDYAAAIAAEMTQPAIEARAVEILMPGVVKPRSRRKLLLGSGLAGGQRLIRPDEV